MAQPQSLDQLQQFQIPGAVALDLGNGGLPRVQVTTPMSVAEVYLLGAQVTSFRRHSEPPLLFLSNSSRFAPGKAIRGGVPICFPWFGPRPGDVSHGYARITTWQLAASRKLPDGGVTLHFELPNTAADPEWARLRAEYRVTITETLTLELVVVNGAPDRVVAFEACLHSYFAVADAGEIAIAGLGGASFVDHTLNDAVRVDDSDSIRIARQTDRTYLDAPGPVEIRDPILGRTICIEKLGAKSTVVWNPWITQPLPDLGPNEYREFICVESGNIGRNRVTLAPGAMATMTVGLRISAC